MEHTVLSLESDLRVLECFIDPDQEVIIKAYLIKDKEQTRESETTQRVILYLQDLDDMTLIATLVEWYPKNYSQSMVFGSIVVSTLQLPPQDGPLFELISNIGQLWGMSAQYLIQQIVCFQPQYLVTETFHQEGLFYIKKEPIKAPFLLYNLFSF